MSLFLILDFVVVVVVVVLRLLHLVVIVVFRRRRCYFCSSVQGQERREGRGVVSISDTRAEVHVPLSVCLVSASLAPTPETVDCCSCPRQKDSRFKITSLSHSGN